MNIFELFATISLTTSGFTSGLKNASDAMQSFGDRVGAIASTVGKAVETGLAVASAAAVKFAKDSVDVGKQFDAAMANVSAISGATGEALNDLRETAIAMGGSTRFSATEAADALGYMAMAGWEPQQMMDGLKGVMDLAAASGTDLATTADIVTDALTAFGLKAKDSAHFADVLAVASSAANTNVSMMGETFKYVAPLAGTLGYNIEDMAVSIGLMANAGIKASQAGTSLRAGLSKLVKPSKEATEALKKLGLTVQEMSDEEIATKTAALEKSVTARERAYSDEEDALKDSLDRQYDALKKSLDKRYDAQKDAFDTEYEERKKALDKSYDTAKDIYDKQYESRKKLLEDEYDALEKKLDDEIEAVQAANEKTLADTQKKQEEEVKAYEEATEAKLAAIDAVYRESLKNTDKDEYDRLKALDDEIAKIQAESDKAAQEAEEAERKQRRAELQAAIDNAKNIEARHEARQKLADYEEKLRQKDAEAARKAQIADLKSQKEQVKEEAKTAREAAKEKYEAETKETKEGRAAVLEQIKGWQKEELETLKANQKEDLKALKESRKEQLEEKRESNATDLKELKALNDERLDSIRELNKSELKELSKAHSDQLSAIRDGNDDKLKEAKNGYSKQLQALKDHHKDELKEYKDSVKQQTEALKKQGEARAAVLTDENGNTRDLINFDKEHLGLINILREKFKGMTQAEQSSTAAAIFGQEAMSGWLAILNASDEDFAKLVAQIDVASVSNDKFAEAMESNGFSADAMRESMARLGITQEEFDAALKQSNGKVDDFREALQKAADSGTTLDDIDGNLTMSVKELTNVFGKMSAAAIMAGTHEDSLAGSATTLGSAIETLRIRIADKLNPTIREFTEFAQESVVTLTKAFEDGDIEGMMDALGPIISKGIGMILEYVPDVVKVGGQLLGALVNGVIENLPLLASGAWEIATELGNQLLNAAPDIAAKGGELLDFIAGGIIENVDMLADTAINLIDTFAGFLADAIPSVAEKLTDVIVEIANALSDPNGLSNLAKSALAILDAIAEALITNIPRLGEAALKLLQGIATAIAENLPHLADTAIKLLIAFGEYLWENKELLLEKALEIAGTLVDAIMESLDVIGDNLAEKIPALSFIFENLETVVAAVVGGFAAFQIALGITSLIGTFTKFIEGATIAFKFLTAAMLTNPLVLIATLIGAVVAALIVLWNTNEDFRNAVINIGNAIKDFVTDLVDGFVKFFTETLPNALADLREFVSQKTEEIKNFFIGLRDGIMEAFSNIGAWFSEKFTAAYNAVTDAWSGAKQWASDRWTDISDAFNGAKEWFSTTFSNAWNGVKEAFGGVKTFFGDVWNDITGIFSNAKEWFKGIGKNIIDGLTEGIGGLWNGFISFLSGKTDEVKDEFEGEQGFDTHSPSKWSEKVFRNVMEGGEIGLERGLPDLLSGAENAVRGIQDALVTDPFNVSYSSGDALSGGYSYAQTPQLAAAGVGYGTPQFEIVIEPSQVVLDKRVVGEILWRYVKTQQRARG